MEIYFITSSIGKSKEFNRILRNLNSNVKIKYTKPDKDIPELEIQNVEEVVKDKVKKAAEIYPKKILMVEDTGLFINALNGFPGCLIHRETKKHGGFSYWCNLLNKKKVKNMSAYAETAIALYLDGEIHIFKGIVHGSIPKSPIEGKYGFGWDSIFIPKGYNKSFAQLKPQEKDKISMRTKALTKLIKYI